MSSKLTRFRIPKLLCCGLLPFSFFSFSGVDDQNFGELTVSAVTSIYDGDTFRANIQSVHPIIGDRISIRLAGIDTPELRGKCDQEKQLARKAKQFTVQQLRSAKQIRLKNITRGKYFRIIADVYVDGHSLNEALIKNQLAVRYSGGTKSKDWCKS